MMLTCDNKELKRLYNDLKRLKTPIVGLKIINRNKKKYKI